MVFHGQFETYPDWVPGMDAGQGLAPITLKIIRVHGFDHTANWTGKVRNVSSVGRQMAFSRMPAI